MNEMIEGKFVVTFRFESGALGVAGKKDDYFAMLLVDPKPGEEVLARGVFCFDSVEQAEEFLEEMKESPEGKKLLGVFEGRTAILPAREIMIQ